MVTTIGITVLGNDTLTLEQVAHVARQPGSSVVTVDPSAAKRMRASVGLRDALIATGQPVYGVTTGFGASAGVQVSADRVAALQHNLIQCLLVGVGPAAAPEVARATMLIRANCLARGLSGVRVEVVELLLACLRRDILPLIPERGSVGASGDLAPLAYVAAMLTGEGPALVAGERTDAATALRAHGLTPLRLEAKEGLALVNGTSFMTAFAALALHDAARLAVVADVCTALAVEALRGNAEHFHPAAHACKPHAGQMASAARIRTLVAESSLTQASDPPSGRDAAHGEPGTRQLDRPV